MNLVKSQSIRFTRALFVSAVLTSFVFSGCASSDKKLKEQIEANPEIVFSAIEKNPERFMEVVKKASQDDQAKGAERAQREEAEQLEKQLKNPLQPKIDGKRAIVGSESMPITIVEYTDFQCPYCSKGFQTVKQVLKAYPGKVRLIVKNLPLYFHPMAMPAAKRFEVLLRTDVKKADKFYNEVFEHQDQLAGDKGEKFLDDTLKKVGANVATVKKTMETEAVTQAINEDSQEAASYGMNGTPGFVVGGVAIRGAYPFEHFKNIIDKKLAQK